MSTRPQEVEGEIIMGWPGRKKPKPTLRLDTQGRVTLARSPVRELEGLITPISQWFNIQHFAPPDPLHPDDWTVSVSGAVERPLGLSFEKLRQFPARTVRTVGECSGNDAVFFDYMKNGGEKPSRAAGQILSAGEFTGVPLAAILEKAGLKRSAVSVRVEGVDTGIPEGETKTINYDKGLPLQKALHPDTLVAWAMNGEWLEHLHGAPARLVVPGWSTNWWIKWIHTIEVLDHPAQCHYQTKYYYFGDSPDDPNKETITSIDVKSMITFPRDDNPTLRLGTHVVRGLAWSGEGGPVTKVDVSVDGGKRWHPAHVEQPVEKWMWARWSYQWDVKQPGSYRIMARATDARGRVQPFEPRWNHLRKNFNAIVPHDVTIE